MDGILIGTLILWGLTAAVVIPLAEVTLAQRMRTAGVDLGALDTMSEADKSHWVAVATQTYILWDVVVLGLAGLIGGILGFFFIGISFEAKGWPGMLAFIGASFLGTALKGG